MRNLRGLLKQHDTGQWLGGLKLQISNAQFYLSMVNMIMVAVAATPQLQKWFPWVRFLYVLFAYGVIFAIAMWLDYKYVYPSVISFSTRQAYKKELNPFKGDNEKIIKELADIKALLEKNGEEKVNG